MTPAVDTLFLDFDGVILESFDIKTEAFRALYAEHGEAVVAGVIAHHREHTGISRLVKIRHCHRELLGIELSDDDVDALGARYAGLVEDQVVAAPWVKGAEAFLESQIGQRPVFVVSGTPDDELKRIVKRRGMEHLFTSVHGSPAAKPEIIAGLLLRLQRDPAGALMVGDGASDHRAATRVGIRFIGRVAPGEPNPFPPAVPTIADLSELKV